MQQYEQELTKEERVEREVAQEQAHKKPWEAYLEAELGFRNHWYAAFFSYEINEGEIKALTLLGEPIIFRRIGGKVYGLRDRCLHRGAALSVKPECYTDSTITCWYHGSTFRWEDGTLVAVLSDPTSSLIGKISIKSYPVQERQGIVFVFIGDMAPPPPLAEDVQPSLLNEDLYLVRGRRLTVRSNWRLGAENGWDAGHLYIHRDSPLITALRAVLPFSVIRYSREGVAVTKEGAPRGVMFPLRRADSSVVFETEIEGVKVGANFMPGQPGVSAIQSDVSMWLPACLKVTNFPLPGIYWLEWYVPIDEHSHYFMITFGREGLSPQEAERFEHEMGSYWTPFIVENFSNQDVMAREGVESFYGYEGGWYSEHLLRPDLAIIEWRKVASACNRGIQRRSWFTNGQPPRP